MIWSLHNVVLAMSSKIKTSKIELISELRYNKQELDAAWSIITKLNDLIESKSAKKVIEKILTQYRDKGKSACWINDYSL